MAKREDETARRKPKPKTLKPHVQKFKDAFGSPEAFKNSDRVAIFTHPCPDPDAIGAVMGLCWLIEKVYPVEADCFIEGQINHPQNEALVNLLHPNFVSAEEFNSSEYKVCVMVDGPPRRVGVAGAKVQIDVVIDHHEADPEYNGVYINLGNGSSCGTVYSLIEGLGQKFDAELDRDRDVATAMLVGIATDTKNLTSDDSTELEFEAYKRLFEFRDPNALGRIIRFGKPKYWVKRQAEATLGAELEEDGLAIVGLGLIPEKHSAVIADMADQMIIWTGVETAVCFALVDHERIEGCVRSSNASLIVNDLACKLGTDKKGSGGGKEGVGAYRYVMAGLEALFDEEDAENGADIWNIVKKKEGARIKRIVKA